MTLLRFRLRFRYAGRVAGQATPRIFDALRLLREGHPTRFGLRQRRINMEGRQPGVKGRDKSAKRMADEYGNPEASFGAK